MIVEHMTFDATLLSSESANVSLWQSLPPFYGGVDTRTYPLIGYFGPLC